MQVSPSELPSEFADALARASGRLGRLGSPILYFTSIGSTNDVAMSLAASGTAEGATVVADEQTSGRGRRGHEWFSPAGSGLYVSVVLTPAAGDERAVRLVTMMAGLALAEGIERQTGLRADIKWPNDLFVGRRKLAGILAEGVLPEGGVSRGARVQDPLHVVLGYGINVEPAAYPRELSDRVTSVSSELGRPVDRADVFVETLAALGRRYDDLLAGRFDTILDGWRARARGAEGAAVEWETPGGTHGGVTCGVDGDGALLVRTARQLERVVSGELRWECF